jgi:hypothetical protein
MKVPVYTGFMQQTTNTRPLAVIAAAIGVLALTVYAALLSISHLGVQVPGLSALGPGGNRVVLMAGVSFAVSAVIYAVIGVGLLQRRRWAWAGGVVVSALTILGGIAQFRGAGSTIGMLLSLVVLLLLLTPQARAALRD